MNASTILLVDDDEVLSQVLRRVLTRQGYNVVNAHNVAQAEQLAQQHHPQLGLLDLCLPDGDGVELARRLSAKADHLPLILLTAYPLRLRERPELAAQFNRVLTKPVNLQELRDAIESVLTEPKNKTASRSREPSGTEAEVPLGSRDLLAQPRQEPVMSAAAPAAPALTTASKSPSPPSRWYAAAIAAVAACVVLLALAGWGFGWYHPLSWFTANTADNRNEEIGPVSPVAGNRDAIALSEDVVKRLKITTAEVQPATAHRPLELAGSLGLDTDQMGPVRTPFAGEVVEFGTVRETGLDGKSILRPLRIGDVVTKDEVIAVIYSTDFGQKKSDLVDALSQLALDEVTLKTEEEAWSKGVTNALTVQAARRAAEQSRIILQRAENSLRTARMTDEEIAALEKELRALGKPQDIKAANSDKYKDWARINIKARFAGNIVEKNVRPGVNVDTATDLFKIADMSRLVVWANVREEDLPAIQAHKLPVPWTVKLATDPNAKPLQGAIVHISPVIDPTQHTAWAMGYVENPEGHLRGAQFITATVPFPDPKDTVAIPTAALVEDGNSSIVFVQPDPEKYEYVMKRVKVAKRYADVVHISNDLTAAEAAPVDKGGQGLQPLRPRLWWYSGELVVTQNALGMKAALDDLQSKKP